MTFGKDAPQITENIDGEKRTYRETRLRLYTFTSTLKEESGAKMKTGHLHCEGPRIPSRGFGLMLLYHSGHDQRL